MQYFHKYYFIVLASLLFLSSGNEETPSMSRWCVSKLQSVMCSCYYASSSPPSLVLTNLFAWINFYCYFFCPYTDRSEQGGYQYVLALPSGRQPSIISLTKALGVVPCSGSHKGADYIPSPDSLVIWFLSGVCSTRCMLGSSLHILSTRVSPGDASEPRARLFFHESVPVAVYETGACFKEPCLSFVFWKR